MSAAAEVLVGLARALREVVRPLEHALDSPQGVRLLLLEHGWQIEGDAAAVLDALGERLGLAERIPALEGALGAVVGVNGVGTEQAAEVLGAARALLDLASSPPTTALPAPLNREAFWSTFPEELVQTLVARHLELRRPALFAVLHLAGVVDRRRVPADGSPGRIAYTRTELRWDRLGRALTDPEALLRELYGWGGPLDHEELTARLQRAAHALGLAATRPLARHALLTDFYAPENPLLERLRELRVPLLVDRDIDAAYLEFGLALLPIPPRGQPGGAPVGLLIGPYAEGEVGTTVPVGGIFALELRGGIVADQAVGVELRPGSVRPRLAGASTVIDAAATLRGAPSAPWTVVGGDAGMRALVHDVELGLEVLGKPSDPELRLRIGTTGLEVMLDADGGDAFIRALLGREPHVVKTSAALVWSSKHGLTLEGSGALSLDIPVGRSVGGVEILLLSLAASASEARTSLSASITAAGRLGPVGVTVQGVGLELRLEADDGGALGGLDVDVGFKPPTGLGLAIDAGPVSGAGFLAVDPDRGQYAGEVQLQFQRIAVRATGLLTTRLPGGKPGFSLLVLVSAEIPPVQLGLGFRLVGVGGLLGINRTVAVEALRAGLKAGALGAVLSPPDPEANPGQLVASLANLFPPAAGRHVFAPTARIVWGAPTLITIDLCLVLELPSPVRLVALGRVRAVLPDEREAIVRLQVDVLGVIDFDRAEAAVDASLIDSRIAQFALTGDMALRLNWGAQPSFLLAVGGFHPAFAAPPGFPALERVAVALAAGDNPKLRLEAYLALTSNTVQFGARVDLAARAGAFSIAGFLSFDALFTLWPPGFVVDIAAKLAVKVGGRTLLAISLALTLSGPSPWRARGRASFSILFFDVSFGFDVTIGDDAPPVLPDPIDVAPLLLDAFRDPRAWNAQLPAGADVVTLRALDPGTTVLAHPLAMLEVRQRVAPLERTLERFGASVPSGARRFQITGATVGTARVTPTPLRDHFAPAQFKALSDDAKLSAPSFTEMISGAALGADGFATGSAVPVDVAYEQVLVTAAGVATPKPQRVPLPAEILAALVAPAPQHPPVFALRATP